ncbi:phytoene/squalene synthase family protein [Methylocystis parvus]|uniref:Squalene synthase n=1 Tax=Methylocystis parvus TaxID=134 RepID=A0A6B8M611_9HYPH|nr:squalene/phytoene synthase family protein [Methylocystis parvus]QGM99454.1 squalene synthase [Methylocystis parvus]WBK00153.1 squalene/phytoene synthase family protein [Methylocystis parvus OBBP]
MDAAAPDHYAICEAQLRERDRDVWLASLFAPHPARRHIHAVYAFAQECAEAPAKVSQPLLGEMRLRWWTDALSGPDSEAARAHPVADALLDTMRRFSLPLDELTALADAHVADLYDDQMPDVGTLEDYCRMTSAAPMRWAARILGAEPSPAMEDAGVALGLARVLRRPSGPLIPADLLAKHGATIHANAPPLRAALAELRDMALARYESARRAARGLAIGREALLPAALVPVYLERMTRKDYDPLRGLPEPSPLRRQWRLWRAARGVGL